jgi:hypothetical protein
MLPFSLTVGVAMKLVPGLADVKLPILLHKFHAGKEQHLAVRRPTAHPRIHAILVRDVNLSPHPHPHPPHKSHTAHRDTTRTPCDAHLQKLWAQEQ